MLGCMQSICLSKTLQHNVPSCQSSCRPDPSQLRASIETVAVVCPRVRRSIGGALSTAAALTVLLLTRPLSAAAEDPAWNALQTKAATLFQRGRYASAADAAEQSVRSAEQLFGPRDLHTAESLETLANVYSGQQLWARAQSLYERVLEIRQQALGFDHPLVVQTLLLLMKASLEQGQVAEAGVLCDHALTIREQQFDSFHPMIAETLIALAQISIAAGQGDAAQALYEQALAIREQHFGPSHLLVAETLILLAKLQFAHGRTAEASALDRRAADIVEQTSGPPSLILANTLIMLAEVSADLGKLSAAEAYSNSALAIQEKRLGRDHPLVADTLVWIAKLHIAEGRSGETELLYERALSIRQRAFGAGHSLVGETLVKLSEVYAAGSRPHVSPGPELVSRGAPMKQTTVLPPAAEEDAVTKETGDAEERQENSKSWSLSELLAMASTLHERAKSSAAVGKHAEADALFKQSLSVYERLEGPDHPDVAGVLNDYAVLLRKSGRFAEAESMEARASRIQAHPQ